MNSARNRLFLDEIGELKDIMQTPFLQALQDGSLDDVRMHNSALTADEVYTLFLEGLEREGFRLIPVG